MPRYKRIKSTSGIYHIMLRGINRMELFLGDSDRRKYLNTLQKFKENKEYQLFAYCLMNNHIHLLIKEKNESIEKSMKRIGVSYVNYFNKKYERVGHLFQDRYKSEPIEDERYFLACARYIHNNPVKADIVEHAVEYPWSSYKIYLGEEDIVSIDTDFLLEMFSSERQKSIEEMEKFITEKNEDRFLDLNYVEMHNVKDIKIIILETLAKHGLKSEDLIKSKDINKRNSVLRELKFLTNASVRELAEKLGVSKDIINRACNKTEEHLFITKDHEDHC